MFKGFILPSTPDKFIWRWSANQQYLASSAYHAFFHGQCGIPGAKELAKTRVVPTSKFFTWLALLDRCWTLDRLHCHHLPNNDPCMLCDQEVETISHICLGCVYSQEVWFRVLTIPGLKGLVPGPDDTLANWWLHS
jgi:hypothetical protein